VDTSHLLPKQFRTSGTTCGIKDSGRSDLALFVSDRPAAAAGVFTTNRVVGAPVDVSRSRVPSNNIRAIVINSGNANACTGEEGHQAALAMTSQVASELGCNPEQVLVCSTGIIGVPLPLNVITAGIPNAVAACEATKDSFKDAATAMMTTDTFAKLSTEQATTANGEVRVSGSAKGAAMIAPDMATMLAVIMTDAALTPKQCDAILRFATDRTFNCISVDGHMSTSDTVLLLANGAVDEPVTNKADEEAIQQAVTNVCEKLATDIIRDAEGAGHFVTVDVSGFDLRETAFQIAKEIAESALVKTAITGNDPNWGRITSAAGYAGVEFDPAYLSLTINGMVVYRSGSPVPFDAAASSQTMQQKDVHLLLELSGGPRSGSQSVRFWTSDLTQEYVRLNSEYTT
jgi:glutamate N-acetyltransferase/amino-acid N-acetyltransferase